MKINISAACFMVGTLLAPVMGHADASVESSNTTTLVKDSVITTKIKAKLASEHLVSATRLKVDTDNAGAVLLSGTAATQTEADKAVSIARTTEGVVSVKSEIVVKTD